jgi:hypothetical protein
MMDTLMVSTEGKYRCVYDADIAQRYQWTPGGLNEANFGKHIGHAVSSKEAATATHCCWSADDDMYRRTAATKSQEVICRLSSNADMSSTIGAGGI